MTYGELAGRLFTVWIRRVQAHGVRAKREEQVETMNTRKVCGLAAMLTLLARWGAMGIARGQEAMAVGRTLYVANNGNDRWSGRIAAPNAAGTDGPLATLEKARDMIRQARQHATDRQRGVTINLRAGVYRLTGTFALEAQDGGTKAAPMVYRAYRNEEVRLIGGQEVTGWQPVTEAAALARLDPAARGHVLQTDLCAQGLTDYGRLTPRGFSRPVTPAALELFFQDRPMTLARWPNGDAWATLQGAPKGAEGGVFTYEGDRPARWTQAEDAWVHGYWTFDWADTYEKIAAIDPARHEIATVPPHGAYGYAPGRRFYALNLLEELDTPGEYYLDRKTGLLYFWPPAPLTEGKTVVSLLESPLITIRNAANIRLRGLILEATRGAGIEVSDCRDCLVAGCTLRDIGTGAVSISGGQRCGVQSCDIYETGDSGVSLSGGDRKTLTPGSHYVVNCHIHHPSRWDRTYRPAIGIDGVGNRATHNLIHDGPHNAILMSGNDHLVEYNDISRVCTQTGDAGAIYMGRDLAQRGTILRYNHLHDIGPTLQADQAGRYTEVMAVYLDDCFCGVTVQGNLFERAGRSIMIGGGRDNTIENNLFIDCRPAIHVDQRGKGWAARYFVPNGEWRIYEHLQEVPYNRPPYSDRYPHLADILSDDPPAARYNRILRNIRYGSGTWIDWLDGMSDKTVETVGNWTEGDPGFVAPARHDYRLKPGAPVRKQGFRPLPLSRIGLQRDAYRRVAPQGVAAREDVPSGDRAGALVQTLPEHPGER